MMIEFAKLITVSGDLLSPCVWVLDFKEEVVVRQETDLQGIEGLICKVCFITWVRLLQNYLEDEDLNTCIDLWKVTVDT